MLAAEQIYASLKDDSNDFSGYEQAIEESVVKKDLYEQRNTRQPFQKGLLKGGPAVTSMVFTKGRFPGGRWKLHRNDAKPMFIGDSKDDYPQPDGELTFDKLSSVFITGNATRDDAPNHIRVQKRVPREIAETWKWMCPAGVYEIPDDAPESGDVDVVVNYTNCVQCGAITAKGGRLTPPRAATARCIRTPEATDHAGGCGGLTLRPLGMTCKFLRSVKLLQGESIVNRGAIVSIAVGLAIGLLAAGCGGGGGDTTSISKAELVKKANNVCARAAKRVSSQFAALVAGYDGKDPKGDALKAAQKKIVETVLAPNKRSEIEQLRKIGTPTGGEAQVEAIVEGLERGIEEAEAQPTLAVTGKVKSFADVERRAGEYGLTGC